MNVFQSPSVKHMESALSVLRVVIGIFFVAHGAQKVFAYGFEGVTAGFLHMGIPFAELAGPAVALTELLGGTALVLGLLTRVFALGLAATMSGAMYFAHFAAGFFFPAGYEFVLVLLTTTLLFVAVGGGPFSVDALIARRRVS